MNTKSDEHARKRIDFGVLIVIATVMHPVNLLLWLKSFSIETFVRMFIQFIHLPSTYILHVCMLNLPWQDKLVSFQ